MLNERQLDILESMITLYPMILVHQAEDGSALLIPAKECPACEAQSIPCSYCEGEGGIPMLAPVLIPAHSGALL